MKTFSNFVSRQARRLLAPLVLSMGCATPAMAVPVLSATPGNASYTFNVGAVHQSQAGAFTDTYSFKLAGDVSLRSIALYFGFDIEDFVAELYGDAGLIATGTSTLAGPADEEAFVNSIFLPGLAGDKEYQLRVSGVDVAGNSDSPYSLSLRVGPVTAQDILGTRIPEPSTLALAGLATLLLLRRTDRHSRRATPV